MWTPRSGGHGTLPVALPKSQSGVVAFVQPNVPTADRRYLVARGRADGLWALVEVPPSLFAPRLVFSSVSPLPALSLSLFFSAD